MRILQMGLSSVRGGVESCILNFARELSKKNIIFDYVDVYGEGLAIEDEINEMGGKIYSLPNYKRHYFRAKRMLEKIIKDNEYEIVHINMLSAASLFGQKCALNAKKKNGITFA